MKIKPMDTTVTFLFLINTTLFLSVFGFSNKNDILLCSLFVLVNNILWTWPLITIAVLPCRDFFYGPKAALSDTVTIRHKELLKLKLLK